MDKDVLFRLTPVTDTFGVVTVTVQVAVLPPSLVLTVIVAVPAAFAVTTPEEETVATDALLEDQVTDLSVAFEGVIVADKVWVSPTVMVIDVLFKLTPVTDTFAAVTVTVQVAVLPPSLVFTVIVAVPAAFAVTTPEEETVATEVLLEDQVTDLSVAFEGVIVADKVWVSPTVMDMDVLLRLTPVTETLAAVTVTVQVAVLPPSLVLTVIVAVPAAFAVTTPEEETVATDALLEDQVTDLSVAFEGVIVADKVCVSPTVMDMDVLLRLTPVTETLAAVTVTVQVAVLPPSLVLTVIAVVPAVLAVTTPEEDTVATEVLLEDQATDLSVAFEGVIVAVRVCVSPSVIVRDVLSRLTPETDILAGLTVTEQLAEALPSSLLQMIVVVPALIA